MQRRKFLSATVMSVGASMIAGCTSSDDEESEGTAEAETENEGETESEDEEEDELTEEDVENRDELENVLTFEDLEINEHELIIEEGEFRDDIYVEGIAENNGEEEYDFVGIDVRVYDPDGHHLDNYITNTQDLAGGRTWAFEVNIREDAEDIEEYDIGIHGSQRDF